MKNIDMELSKKVAKEASEKINKTKKELEDNKDAYISFMRDVFDDTRKHTKFNKKLIVGLLISNVVFFFLTIGLAVYSLNLIKKTNDENTQKITEFMNQFDFYSEVEILNELSDYNNNNLNINK